MSKLRAQQKAQRRELIEIAAKNLFVEKGFELASIEEIAALAMVSQATVYNYYGSKDELLPGVRSALPKKTRNFLIAQFLNTLWTW